MVFDEKRNPHAYLGLDAIGPRPVGRDPDPDPVGPA